MEKQTVSSIEQVLSDWMRKAFAAEFPEAEEWLSDLRVMTTASPEFGDYQCNAAMGLARRLKQNPRQLAQRVAAGARHESVAALEVAGPGFINITLDDAWLGAQMERLAADPDLGVPKAGAGRTMLLDYSSPNVAKPMHIGHIRSTVIGNALYRLHRFLGWRVISDNHLGDWGTQFGIIIMGFKHNVNLKALETEPIDELERIYRESYKRAQENPEWLDACRRELVRLQSGDPENLALWKRFVDLSMGEFSRIYKRLDVSFDMVRGESFYNDQLAGVVEQLTSSGLARESEGAIVAFLDDEKLPPCLVRKSDGAFNYATTDIATIRQRVKEFNPDLIVYVTDERQQLHFNQVFTVSRKLGVTTRLEHVWFGLMRLPEGTFSTREGNVIKLERLLDEAESKALAVVREASPDMDADRQKEVARAVGIGAVKYADLSQNPQSLVVFTWEKALALNGNSAPYLQYAYARIRSVQDKYAERFPSSDLSAHPIRLTEKTERALAVKAAGFADAVMLAAGSFKPSVLADYLYGLAGLYSSFYQNVPFLKADAGLRESRIRLCGVTAAILRKGLSLLGIETMDRI